ncbi:MAG TPA: hypothetical protein VNR38_01390 [Ureibacillus sp.]|nr:hypothetical protein [Ureibacillus sp.]
MNPPFKNQLKDWKQHQESTPKKKKKRHQKTQKRKSEQLSDWEWKELMGQFDQRLSRHNGALRRGR